MLCCCHFKNSFIRSELTFLSPGRFSTGPPGLNNFDFFD